MKLTELHQTATGEDRLTQKVNMPTQPPDGEPIPQTVFKVPSVPELMSLWMSCLDLDRVRLFMGELGGGNDALKQQNYSKLFFHDYLNPTIVNIEQLVERVTDKYVVGWTGITDDDKTPIAFDKATYKKDIMPSFSIWIAMTILTLAIQSSAAIEAEKKT